MRETCANNITQYNNWNLVHSYRYTWYHLTPFSILLLLRYYLYIYLKKDYLLTFDMPRYIANKTCFTIYISTQSPFFLLLNEIILLIKLHNVDNFIKTSDWHSCTDFLSRVTDGNGKRVKCDVRRLTCPLF